MEVIHRYNGAYPFFLDSDGGQTYLEILKTGLSQQEIADQREKMRILNEIDQSNLIKLVKIYRENSDLHLLYEYFPISLEKYVEERSLLVKNNEKNEIKQLHECFVGAIDCIVDTFVEGQIKTDININNMAVSSIQEGCLKLFIDPSAEFHRIHIENFVEHLNRHFNCRDHKGCKVRLEDFYSAQKKRLVMEFQEWLQKYFGKSHFGNEPNHPNFVISGTKLVFINQNQPNSKGEAHHKNRHISEGADKGLQGKNVLRNSPGKLDKMDDMKRDLMEKTMKKIEEIKGVLNRIQSKTPNFNQQQNEHRLIPHKPHEIHHEQTHHENKQHVSVLPDKPHPPRPFNQHNLQPQQAESIIFSSQDGSIDKPKNMHQPADEKRSSYLQYINSGNKVKRVPTLKEEQKEKNREQIIKPDRSTHVDSKIIPNNSTTKLDALQKEGVTKIQVKREDKPNKYKMKITTSHQIEIEGKGQPQIEQIEKDIMEGIKSGRIPLSEFSEQPKGFKIQATSLQQVSQPEKDDKANTSGESPRQYTKLSEIGSKRHHHTVNSVINQEYLSSSVNEHKGNGLKTQNDCSSQGYSEKIRQARSKAEEVLKQYAKKKL